MIIRLLLIIAILFFVLLALALVWKVYTHTISKKELKTYVNYLYFIASGIVVALLATGMWLFINDVISTEGTYVRPTYKDGKLVPGYIEKEQNE